ncbi:hypothetical protein VPFG_00314 [Vibrio phage nt-1]|uniref:Uncharacterized protein n=1 Tax=Vibrio phage nt-1 TaxID=115992 RepID=R9TJM8_9CAUD|nr:hypothetical protein VPFG_00314 [Vibrio phage nt-1]AGN30312.1 hypothetical protein VPFG_00314 [Vibrio phage nt-1]
MGSFNTTCAISRTPINEGDEARVFFLIMQANDIQRSIEEKQFSNIMMGCGCYPWDNFKIIGYPLKGKYADYNRYEFEDQQMSDEVLRLINKIYMPNRVTEGKELSDYNSYHDYMEIDEIESMHELQDMEHSGALRVESYFGPTAIVKMAIHEEIYQELIISGEMTTGWGEDAKTKTFEQEVQELYERHAAAGDKDPLSPDDRKLIDETRADMYAKADAGEADADGKIITREIVDKMIERFENMLARKTDYYDPFDRAEWSERTYPVRSMQESDDNEFIRKLAEGHIGLKWTALWFQANNYEFGPAITSGQWGDRLAEAERLRKLADIVESKVPEYYYEEHIPVRKERTVRLVMKRSELVESYTDWYGEDADEMAELQEAIDSMKEQSSFKVGDENCKMAQFLASNECIMEGEAKDGDMIEFIFD